MGKIVRYKNTPKLIFCNIKLDSGEQILISVAQSGLKILRLFLGAIPIKTVVNLTLEEMADLFADPKHYGEPILDKIVEKLIDCKSIEEIKNKIKTLKEEDKETNIRYNSSDAMHNS